MHLWPSMRLRESFNSTYLKKLDWNLRRMKSEKKQQTDRTESSSDNQKKLLEDDDTEKDALFPTKIDVICRELLLILSCCYCCFCCGACVDGEGS